ncbi:hypothetical protein HG536_0B05280 [Torulaspora globosa]|uniref:Proteasome assembly chaperone 1 n=1 Tax=Torulaspora globosa TaxID=48254 RepID=A0A7G3ZDS7_9SACH|nr:uncharacterized protein HG536_0B05280 [Torulaspora globosa]QLL31663.1 hypothetical protein HG536_0B05280 [Torulaspora globosa]
MLFKQWNEIAEPRHQLDSPVGIADEGTLQPSALPKVTLPVIDFKRYRRVVLSSAIMNPLFPERLLKLACVGDMEATLDITTINTTEDHAVHSWSFDENFPNEMDPERAEQEKSRSFRVSTPIVAFDDTLIISLKENFLKDSPIFTNIIAEQIVRELASCGAPSGIEVVVLGTSDQVAEMKRVDDSSTTLNPPEFVTGFAGAVLTQLIGCRIPFQGIIAPSEGPIGYEKLNLVTMQELVNLCHQWVTVDREVYKNECYRRWRLEGAAIGAQSGLYI